MNSNITSTANPKIKWVKSLHKNSTRREEGVFLVEGAKEIAFAVEGGYVPRSMFICPEIYGRVDVILNSLENLPTDSKQILNQVQDDTSGVFTVTKDVFEKVVYRGNSDGLLAVFQARTRQLEELNFGESPFFLIVEGVEKLGNLGAIIRTADTAGVDGVIVCDERTDIFNPNVIRSSVGTVFSKQVVAANKELVFDFLEKHEIAAFGAILSVASDTYYNVDFTNPVAIVLGIEHKGLSKFWKERVQPVQIPMLGSNDSLNVSNAAAIFMYEVLRQRSETYDDSSVA